MRSLALVAAVTVTLAAACGDPNALPDPQTANVVDTMTISALTDTPIQEPSALSLPGPRTIRTDLSADFDFAFDFRGGTPVLLPRSALNFPAGSSLQPGLQHRTEPFDQIKEAVSNGYVTRDTLQIAVGDRFMARSRVVCSNLGVGLYGKLQVIAIDAAARTVTFELLADQNCGYTGLEPGLPHK